MKKRRSLSHVGGGIETAGDREIARLLAQALDVEPAPEIRPGAAQDDPDRAHVHGFHTYAARMHPTTAARLVHGFSDAGDTLLDPFCGSGTVLVEAMLAARRAVGVDLSPLAVRLARLKATPRDSHAIEAMLAAAQSIAAFADSRREQRAGATRRYPSEDVISFDPHVLLELDSLRAGIARHAQDDPAAADTLELVLSAILVKVSRRASDTSTTNVPRRLAAGFTTRLFVRKAEELARRLGALAAIVPAEAVAAQVSVDDATRLKTIAASTIDAVVTSPPYVATYDYSVHHAMRMRWLGLDRRALEVGEVGARRRYARLEPQAARAAWMRELATVIAALSRVCRKGARAAIVAGDSAVGGEALRADETIAAVAPGAGFVVLGRASQRRPHFHEPSARAFRHMPRTEHAIAIEKR
jgi:DNA modification methylase